MEGMFGAGVKVTSFQSSQWKAITFGSGIRTELFPKVYLDPNNLWVEEYEELIGTTINSDTFETLEGMKVSLIEENVGENIKYHAYANGLIIKETMDGGKSSYEVVSEVIYKENDQADEPQENKVLDGIQLGLDILGLIPVVGEVADGVNGIIYTARGDMLNAGLSFGSMIPFVGWGTTGARFAIKGGRAIEDARDVNRVTENVKPGSQGMDDTTSYFRVQGGEMPNASQVRIQVDNNGRMIIPNKDANLNVSAGTREHAEYFLEKRGAGAEIVEIEVPRWFDDFVQESAIPQFRYKNNPLNQGGTAPKVVDPSTPGTSFEFPSPWIEWLEEYGKIKK